MKRETWCHTSVTGALEPAPPASPVQAGAVCSTLPSPVAACGQGLSLEGFTVLSLLCKNATQKASHPHKWILCSVGPPPQVGWGLKLALNYHLDSVHPFMHTDGS